MRYMSGYACVETKVRLYYKKPLDRKPPTLSQLHLDVNRSNQHESQKLWRPVELHVPIIRHDMHSFILKWYDAPSRKLVD
jgi:hypothetical protein